VDLIPEPLGDDRLMLAAIGRAFVDRLADVDPVVQELVDIALVDQAAALGGIHLRGVSSTGKSTALAVAGSVWGGGEPGGYVRSWRATANGLEGVALGHCDALLCLDELGELGAGDAGDVAYMLANGVGKSRSTRDGSVRRAARWRLLFLSSGEIGLAEKAAETGNGRRLAPGQQVRILDLPADAGAGLGLFEDLHGFASAEPLARHLKIASARFFGTAARAFLRHIVQDLDRLRVTVSARSTDFIERYVPDEADGQVQRAANRFALIAAAGEIAVEAGVVSWPPGEATKAAGRCFGDWLNSRGGTEAPELREGIERVRAFLLAHGMSRFVPAWENPLNAAVPTHEIAGYRKQEGEGWDYYVTTTAWREELCAGFNSQSIAAALAERGMLLVQDDRHRAKAIKIPRSNKVRAYHLRAAFLEADRE
jgi:putative DNA primase/helicase